MSNLIKSNYVVFEKGETRIIDSNIKSEQFIPTAFISNEELSEEQIQEIEGIPQNKIEKLVMEETDFLKEKANNMLEEAIIKSKEIIEEANIQAIKEKEVLFQNAKEEGYQEGYQSGIEEVERLQEELLLEKEKQQKEYEKNISELEPKFADIVISLVGKITGVVIEDKKEIILHLIKGTLNNLNNNMSFLIKVSKDDYNQVYTHKEEFLSYLREGVQIEIFEDQSLEKNQCMIETETSIIDCSLDVQLNNLITDLKLLANIS